MSDRARQLLEKLNSYKVRTKELKTELDAEIEKMELYQIVLKQTLAGDYEISEKDAKKHANSVCLKNLSSESV